MTEILDDTQVAELLGCDALTVQELARSQKLPAVKFGRSWRYPREALMKALNDMAARNIEPKVKPAAVGVGNKRRRAAVPAIVQQMMDEAGR